MAKLPSHSIRLRINAISAAGSLLIFILAFIIILYSVGKEDHLEINMLRTKISDDINELTTLQAMERGLGATILSGDKSLLAERKIVFETSQKFLNSIIENIDKFKNVSGMKTDIDAMVTEWRKNYTNVNEARSLLNTNTISTEEWFDLMTKLISHEFNIRDMLFKPINGDEAIFYNNSILRPSISILTEYAGRERAILASAITQNRPISKLEQTSLIKFYGEMDRIILQIDLLKHSPSLDPALLADIHSFEDKFIQKHRRLTQKIYAISLDAEKLQGYHEHALDHLSESFNFSMLNSAGNKLPSIPKDIVAVDSQGFYINKHSLTHQKAQSNARINIKDKLGAISGEILSDISGTIYQDGKIISYHRVNYGSKDPSKYIVLIKSSVMPSYPVSGKEWFDQATNAINSAFKISRTAGMLVKASEDQERKTSLNIYIIEAAIIALTLIFLINTVRGGQKISMRLGNIRRGLRKLSAGELDARIEANTGHDHQPNTKLDEIDELIVNINAMAEKLEQMVENISLAEASANAANISKSQFLSNMSHEIRTPLNAIIGFSSIIKDGLFGKLNNEKYEEYLEDIEESGQHLLNLINDLLDLSNIEAGKLEMEPVILNVEEEIATCCRLTKSLTKAKNLTVTNIELEDPDVNIFVDERRFRQIMLNIMSNAIKYTPTDGAITFRKEFVDDDHIKIIVTDTGVGMNTETLKNIFKAYSRSDDLYSKQQEGTGLGLHLTQELIRALGGRMHIDSELGVGTAVTITLPLFQEDK